MLFIISTNRQKRCDGYSDTGLISLTRKVFVVEDERAFMDVYRRIFEMIDLEISDWAFSGEEAVEKLRTAKPRPDLIIMDHRLPKMNGVETMIEIFKIDPPAKVLFVSADEKARKLALENGAADFILKPFSLTEFTAKIADCLKKGKKPKK